MLSIETLSYDMEMTSFCMVVHGHFFPFFSFSFYYGVIGSARIYMSIWGNNSRKCQLLIHRKEFFKPIIWTILN